MTNKARKKTCEYCGKQITERYGDSNSQWDERRFCVKSCSNKSNSKVVDIFIRLERFQVVINGSECFGWSGAKDGKGYGLLSSRKGHGCSPEKAHRVSYEKEYGEIPKGKKILHKCDNPECTNPKHLFAGTQKDNMQDCSRKGRLNKKSLKNLKSYTEKNNGQ